MITTLQSSILSHSDNFTTISSPENLPPSPENLPPSSPEIESLRRLSDNLTSLLHSPRLNSFSDGRIAVGAAQFPIHKCVLSARSSFFRDFFARNKKKRRVRVALKDLVGDFDVGADAFAFVVEYLYSAKVGPLTNNLCVCADEECLHVACRPMVDFMVQVLFASFTFRMLELVDLFERHLLDVLDKVAIDDVPVILCAANLCGRLCGKLLSKCIEIVVMSDLDVVTLEKALPPEILKQVEEARTTMGLQDLENSGYPDKHVKRIHRALDSNDFELVGMLLNEEHTSLDDAYALHYAVAHCDLKTSLELLDFGQANINHRNQRGYTVLHIAAIRKEPELIISLLTKGARSADLTLDGRKAVQIAKRCTKYVDYCRATEEGKASSKERLCIEILEQDERRDSLIREASVSLAMAGDDLCGRLVYLEDRVSFARGLFPEETRVAMDIAQVDGTLEFSPCTAAIHRSTVYLNETPFKIKAEHLIRMKALSRIVELGKRFFPNCSLYLNKIMDDDVIDLTSEDQRNRFMELQDLLTKAFSEDKEEFDKFALSARKLV